MDPMKTKLICATLLTSLGVLVSVSAADAPAAKPWAYQPVQRPDIPAVAHTKWVRTPVDAFVLAKLEAAGLAPSKEADRATFIRRATLDTWGLLPTPEEVRDFEKDRSKDAYEKLVERLLASPRYGERWGRRWLDLSRYADSDGYNADGTRPNIWRYRDYVIKSLNDDKPYDRFVKEQLAGDELWPTEQEALIATGFLRNFPDEINARDLNLKKQEVANDLTDTVGSVLLGSTGRLRAMPQPQVRQDFAEGVLPAAIVLRERELERRRARCDRGGDRRVPEEEGEVRRGHEGHPGEDGCNPAAGHRQARGRPPVGIRAGNARFAHEARIRADAIRPLDLPPQPLDHAGPHAQRGGAAQAEGAREVSRVPGARGGSQEVRQAEAEGARTVLDDHRAGSRGRTADVCAVQGASTTASSRKCSQDSRRCSRPRSRISSRRPRRPDGVRRSPTGS
jgi:hypothetical protein